MILFYYSHCTFPWQSQTLILSHHVTCWFLLLQTVKVQGNDISHKLQLSRVSKSDEGLYECRVTRANYGEIVEYKAQAWLKVNATARPRRPPPPPKKSSPLHLTDKKPRKSSSPAGQDNMSSDQRVTSTSTSHMPSKAATHNHGSGKDGALAHAMSNKNVLLWVPYKKKKKSQWVQYIETQIPIIHFLRHNLILLFP